MDKSEVKHTAKLRRDGTSAFFDIFSKKDPAP